MTRPIVTTFYSTNNHASQRSIHLVCQNGYGRCRHNTPSWSWSWSAGLVCSINNSWQRDVTLPPKLNLTLRVVERGYLSNQKRARVTSWAEDVAQTGTLPPPPSWSQGISSNTTSSAPIRRRWLPEHFISPISATNDTDVAPQAVQAVAPKAEEVGSDDTAMHLAVKETNEATTPLLPPLKPHRT